MKIAVLGSGPAGLLAAQALTEWEEYPDIYSAKRRSPIPGAQYLHGPVPGITEDKPEFQVLFRKVGRADIYALKSHGTSEAKSSWDRWESGHHPGWSLREAYDRLCLSWWDEIKERNLDAESIRVLIAEYDFVISSIPMNLLCSNPDHEFEYAHHWAMEDPLMDMLDNTIVYDGMPQNDWHRVSKIDGITYKEFADGYQPEGARLTPLLKPKRTNCDCHPELFRVGRFGKWDSSQLTYDAYADVHERVAQW